MRLNFAMPSRMPSASGSAPPESEVPAPRGTTFRFCSWQYFRTAATSAVVEGRTTSKGGWR